MIELHARNSLSFLSIVPRPLPIWEHPSARLTSSSSSLFLLFLVIPLALDRAMLKARAQNMGQTGICLS